MTIGLLATIRPSAWEFPLFLHVLGATVLVGGLLTVVVSLALATRTDDAPALTRLAFRSALFVVVPAFVVMRIGAQWLVSREFGDGSVPDWVDVGYFVADAGAALLLATIVLAGVVARRRGEAGRAAVAAAVVGGLLLLAYLVAVWAMTAKPG